MTHSHFAVAPLDGSRSLYPLSLMVVATICMMFTQRHWTTLSLRRAVLSLVVSLAVSLVIARGCIEGLARKDGVFLRTSKASAGRTIVKALRLTAWETIVAVALYVSAGLLATLHHRPWLLMVLVVSQATIYLCAPIVAVWNLHALSVPGHVYRRRFAEARLRAQRRRRRRLPRPVLAALSALCVGALASPFVAGVSLLHGTSVARANLSPRSLVSYAGGGIYLRLGSAAAAYYPITSVSLSDPAASSGDRTAAVGLSFETSSLTLLDAVLRAADHGGGIDGISLAFRAHGVTERVDSFATATVTSLDARLSATPSTTISLELDAAGDLTSARGTPASAGPFAAPSAAPATRAYVRMGDAAYPVSAVSISHAAPGAPLELGFTASATRLLSRISSAEGHARPLPWLTLTVADPAGRGALSHTFSKLTVNAMAENVADAPAESVTLITRPR